MGIQFVADEGFRADTVTAFWVKDGTAGDIQKTLEDKHRIGRGQGDLRRQGHDDKNRALRNPHAESPTSALHSMDEVIG